MEEAKTFRQVHGQPTLVPEGKSLSGGGKPSPTVQFRVPESLREQLDRQATAEGVSPSRIARQALEEHLNKAS